MSRRRWIGAAAFALGALVLVSGCKKDEPAGQNQTVRFSKVPLAVDIPPAGAKHSTPPSG